MNPKEYLNDKRKACERCGIPKDDVEPRVHPFVVERIWDWARFSSQEELDEVNDSLNNCKTNQAYC